MPKPARASVAVGEGMNELEFVMENRAFYKRMQRGFLIPREQMGDVLRNQIRRRCRVHNHIPRKDPHTARAEPPALGNQSSHHGSVRTQHIAR